MEKGSKYVIRKIAEALGLYENTNNPNRKIVDDEIEEIELVSDILDIPFVDIRLAFLNGTMKVLTNSIWSKLENTDSYEIDTLKDAIALAKEYGKDWRPTLDAVKEDKKINPPLVLNYAKNKYYLVGGNTRLMFSKVLGKTPKVLMATLKND